MALTQEEDKQLRELLAKIDWESKRPFSVETFHAWCAASITTPVELFVLRRRQVKWELLLLRRDDNDPFFAGEWHVPGTIMLKGESPDTALRRLRDREVGETVTEPVLLETVDIPMGTGHGDNPRGQEVTRLYLSYWNGKGKPRHGKFFPLGRLPYNMVGHHFVHHLAVLDRYIADQSRWRHCGPAI